MKFFQIPIVFIEVFSICALYTGDQTVLSFSVSRETGHYHAGERFYIFNLKDFSPMICFPKKQGMLFYTCVCIKIAEIEILNRSEEWVIFILTCTYFS